MRIHRTLARSAAVAAAMTLAFTLSGCFANPLDQLTDRIGAGIAEGGAEKLVEGITGSKFDVEVGSMPKDFPAEVPVIDGDVVSSLGMAVDSGKMWTVGIKVDDTVASMSQARDQIASAGFEESMWSDTQGMTMGMFTSDTYSVTISGMFSDDDAQVVTYQVIESTK